MGSFRKTKIKLEHHFVLFFSAPLWVLQENNKQHTRSNFTNTCKVTATRVVSLFRRCCFSWLLQLSEPRQHRNPVCPTFELQKHVLTSTTHSLGLADSQFSREPLVLLCLVFKNASWFAPSILSPVVLSNFQTLCFVATSSV